MQINNKIISEIIKQFEIYDKIVFVSHKKPDGDAMSSSYGLALAVAKAFPKKDIKVVIELEEFTKLFPYLDINKSLIQKPNQIPKGKYLMVIGDTSIKDRIRGSELLSHADKTVCFDHHVSDGDFDFSIFWKEPTYDASSMQAILIAQALLGKKMNEEIAFHLIVGVYTDTGFFKYSLAKTLPLKLVSDCLEFVSDKRMDYFFNKMGERTKDDLKLTRYIYSKLNYLNDFAYVVLKRKQIRKFGNPEDIGKRVYLLSNIQGIKKWALFTEEEIDGQIVLKGHLRSNGPAVVEVAKKYKGGGHLRAAGCTIHNKKELKRIIVELGRIQ